MNNPQDDMNQYLAGSDVGICLAFVTLAKTLNLCLEQLGLDQDEFINQLSAQLDNASAGLKAAAKSRGLDLVANGQISMIDELRKIIR